MSLKPSFVDLHFPLYTITPTLYIFKAWIPVYDGIIWNKCKIRENATDYLPISGEDDLPPIFMKWDSPSIICRILCFQNVFFFNIWKQICIRHWKVPATFHCQCSWECQWPQWIMNMEILLYINDKYKITLQTSLLLKFQTYETIPFNWPLCSSATSTRN